MLMSLPNDIKNVATAKRTTKPNSINPNKMLFL